MDDVQERLVVEFSKWPQLKEKGGTCVGMAVRVDTQKT